VSLQSEAEPTEFFAKHLNLTVRVDFLKTLLKAVSDSVFARDGLPAS